MDQYEQQWQQELAEERRVGVLYGLATGIILAVAVMTIVWLV
jgi:tetrahydromethanopterin S-methyltransferase subunit G